MQTGQNSIAGRSRTKLKRMPLQGALLMTISMGRRGISSPHDPL
jgi:hypothetical protein